MSIYRCSNCEEYKDADIAGCNKDPRDECECWCDDCTDKMDWENDYNTEVE